MNVLQLTCGVHPGEWVFPTAIPSQVLCHSLQQGSSDLHQAYGDSLCCHPSREVCLSKVEWLEHT